MRWTVVAAVAGVLLACCLVARGQETAPDSPQPVIPQEETAPGFRLERALATGLIESPAAMAFDEAGRVFVAGRAPNGADLPGVVTVIEDRDADGIFESATPYVTGLRAPTGLACWDGGVFVADAPDILYCRDTDGDNRADLRVRAISGFGVGAPEDLLRALTWGPDLRIHGIANRAGGAVKRADAPSAPARPLDGADFAIDPRLRTIIPAGGGGRHALSFDAFGRMYTVADGGTPALVMYDGVRVARAGVRVEPGPLLLLASTEGGAARDVRAITVYGGDAWPAAYRDRLIVADAAAGEIRALSVAADGPGVREDVAASTLLYRGPAAAAPVQLTNGPDGSLYLLVAATEGAGGDVFRIAGESSPERPGPMPGQRTSAELVGLLGHANLWHRETAARLLYAAHDRSVLPALAREAQSCPAPEGRATALHTLAALGAMTPELLAAALTDTSATVRMAGLFVTEAALRASAAGAAISKVPALANDSDAAVRYRAAFTFGALPRRDRPAALEMVVRRDGASPWLRAALAASLHAGAQSLLATLLHDADFRVRPEHEGVLRQLATLAGADAKGVESPLAAVDLLDALPEDESALRGALASAMAMGAGGAHNRTLARMLVSARGATGAAMQDFLAQARTTAADSAAPLSERLPAIEMISFDGSGETAAILAALLIPSEAFEVQSAAVAALSRVQSDGAVADAILAAWGSMGPETRVSSMNLLLARDAWVRPVLDALEAGSLTPRALDTAQVQQLRRHRDPAVRERASGLLARHGSGPHADAVDRFRVALRLPASTERGRALFTENCAKCHAFDGQGIQVGPELSFMAKSGSDRLLKSIVDPNAEVNLQYNSYTIETNDFQTITGIIAAEGAGELLVRGPSGEEHVVTRDNIGSLTCSDQTLMPEGWDTALGEQGLSDLITYLVTAASRAH